MKILYISTVCTPKVFEYVFTTSELKPGQAVQKFHRLLVEGLSMNWSSCQVEALSNLPVSSAGHNKMFWKIPNELWNGVKFSYIPFINFPVIKHVFVFHITFFKLFYWYFINRNKQKIVVCDILNVSMVWATFLVCRLCNQPIAVIITDLPKFLVSNSQHQFFLRLYLKMTTYVLNNFDYYIGLTAQMNAEVNPYNKPFLVMEGLVDSKIVKDRDRLSLRKTKRILLYAGGIFEKYGVRNLIEAFLLYKALDVELHIYGSGDLESDMPKYCLSDSRISYYGVVSNTIVVDRLKEATILVNPRPTTEEFTKFSFPSKNMEYMVSGTPLLTTKLPGMSKEYYDYVYLIEDESVAGIHMKLNELFGKSDDDLRKFGYRAQCFVLKNKTNEIQAKRIIDFLA